MHAEILAIGTELTTGAKLDTNSQWLSLQLAAVGIPVRCHLTVADDVDAMVGALRLATDRSEVVLVTGGLGPTLDDLTRDALALLIQSELVRDEESLEHIRSLFRRFRREMPERNVVQAMFPKGSTPIPNPRGTAPGIWMNIPRSQSETPCLLAAMPGVPSEMKHMFHSQVLPKLPDGGNVIRRARINCFGLGESAAEEMLGELTARGREPEVGITVHEATITLRIASHGQSIEECNEKIDADRQTIRRLMSQYVFGEEDEELEHIVVGLLNDCGETLATAESGTGGLLAHRLTNVADFERCYLGGVVAPTGTSKNDLLDVLSTTLEADGAISAAVVGEMAVGCRNRFGTDYALSITECPRLDPEQSTAESSLAYIALAGDNLLEVRRHRLIGDPAIAKSRAAKDALNLLRLHLIHEHGGASSDPARLGE